MEKGLSDRWARASDRLYFLIDYQEQGRSIPEDKETAAEKMNELLDVFEEAFGVTFSRVSRPGPQDSSGDS